MTDSTIDRFRNFRNRLFNHFHYRADATMDLIDATAGGVSNDSVVKISLSSLFRRTYSSITDVLDNMFRRSADKIPNNEEMREEHLEITKLLAEECPTPKDRAFALFALDCTANPRIYAETVEDRQIVYAPNHVPGQKPITVGHQYSALVFLPEKKEDRKSHWVVPLTIRRVNSHENGTQIGFEQLNEVATQTVFKNQLCVNVADAAYSNRQWIVNVNTKKLSHVIHIARLRGNRVLYRQPLPLEGARKRGRPKIYGEVFRLSDPPVPDQEEKFSNITKRGKVQCIHVSRWYNLLTRGKKNQHMEKYPFDVVRVQVFNEEGKSIYKKPLWIMVTGKRRAELSLKQVREGYGQRYDIEHYFRFGKQKLLATRSQTPVTKHEENWWWITTLAYTMLYHSRTLAVEIRYPWENRKITVLTQTLPATQVQRDYNRIIREIGTPASIPKPRGKSPGRQYGAIVPKRHAQEVIRKQRRMPLLL